MRALSLRQPYAHVVVHYGKTIENRRWNTSFRGEFLIHAAKGKSSAYVAAAMAFIADVLGAERFAEFARDFEERAQLGGVIGRARIVVVVPPNHRRGLGKDTIGSYPPDVDPRWHMREQYGFVLANVAPLPFSPLKGKLGLFRVTVDEAPSMEGLS